MKKTYDTLRASEAQKKYCGKKNYPHLRSGISVEEAGCELITGCPFCNWSYCE